MAATDMRKAGLEIGCRGTRIGWPGVVEKIDDEEPRIFFRLDTEGSVPNPVWCDTADIERDYEDAQAARQARYERLNAVFPDAYGQSVTDTLERFCAPCGERGATVYAYVWADTFEECAEQAGGNVLDGMFPEAVYDLDTGTKIELHIASPVITRSEDQGITVNPLDVDERASVAATTARVDEGWDVA